MALVCDLCGQRPAYDTAVTTVRTIPGTGGREGRAKSEKINTHRLGELCEACGDRYDLALGNLIASLKTGETELPERTESEPEQVELPPIDQPTEHQPPLPLGGDDGDSGPNEQTASAPGDGHDSYGQEPVHSTRKRDRKQPVTG